MKRLLLPLTLVGFSVISSTYLTSCKDDEDPAPIPKITFASGNQVVNEDDGTIQVVVELDRPAPEDIVVEYSISGTATRKTSTNAAVADFEITGFLGEIEIDEGETSGTITIGIIDDVNYEEDETIILSLEDVDSDKVDFGERTETTVTIVSDDAAITASFAAATLTVNESFAEFHEIVVQLDKPAPADMTISYDLGEWLDGGSLVPGVAIDTLRASDVENFPDDLWDYYIDGTSGELTIEAGETSGVIRINILSDFLLEDNETITLTLKAGGGVTVGANPQMVITVEQEDGRVVILDWAGDNVDMDLFGWFKVEASYQYLFSSASASFDPPEGAIIPSLFLDALAENGYTTVEFGMSYVYYEGPADPVEFQSIIADFADDAFEPVEEREIKTATYTSVNKNPWDTEAGTDFEIEQTFTYTAGAYQPVSDITVPAAGSRRGTIAAPDVQRRAPRFLHEIRNGL